MRYTNFSNFVTTMVARKEYFPILEDVKCLFRHFLQYSLHVAA